MSSFLSIIVPMLNEREIVDETIDNLARAVGDADGWEVLLVDAGSRDGTAERARELGTHHGFRFVDGSKGPRSVGGTISEGARAARGETILVLPADTALDARALAELREAVARGARSGGFPKRYVPETRLLRAYAALQNAVRFRLLKNVVWTNGIFFPRGTAIPTVGFLEDVILSDTLKGPGWRALRSPIRVSARRYYPNRTLRRILVNLAIMALYRSRLASPGRLRRFYASVAVAVLSCLSVTAQARPLIFSLVTGYDGNQAGACHATPVYRRTLAFNLRCDFGFLTAAHCFRLDFDRRASFRRVVLGENLSRKLSVAAKGARVVMGPEFNGRPLSRDDEAMLFVTAPCDYLAESELSALASQRPHVGDRLVTVNRKGEEVVTRLDGSPAAFDQWQAKLEGKASISHGDSGSPIWNERGEVVGTLSRAATHGASKEPFALTFAPNAVEWARGIIAGETTRR